MEQFIVQKLSTAWASRLYLFGKDTGKSYSGAVEGQFRNDLPNEPREAYVPGIPQIESKYVYHKAVHSFLHQYFTQYWIHCKVSALVYFWLSSLLES